MAWSTTKQTFLVDLAASAPSDRVVTLGAAGAYSVAFSEDSQYLAFTQTSTEGKPSVVAVRPSQPHAAIPMASGGGHQVWVAGRHRLAVWGPVGLDVVDLKDGAASPAVPVRSGYGPAARHYEPWFGMPLSPSRRWIVGPSPSGVYAAPLGGELGTPSERGWQVLKDAGNRAYAVNPVVDAVLTFGGAAGLMYVDLANDAQSVDLGPRLGQAPAFDAVWAPDGQRAIVLSRTDDGEALTLLDVKDAAHDRVLLRANGLRPLGVSPSGRRLLITVEGRVEVVDLSDGSDKARVRVDPPLRIPSSLRPFEVRFTPNDDWAFFVAPVDNRAGLFRVDLRTGRSVEMGAVANTHFDAGVKPPAFGCHAPAVSYTRLVNTTLHHTSMNATAPRLSANAVWWSFRHRFQPFVNQLGMIVSTAATPTPNVSNAAHRNAITTGGG